MIHLNNDKIREFPIEFPATKLMLNPLTKIGIFGTCSDHFRLFSLTNGINLIASFKSRKEEEFDAPLTSFDWNNIEENIIVTSSIDTTCTVWDLNKNKPLTRLIAHDSEVHDVQFSAHREIFSSAGADGSLRLFDLRQLQHSTILYETTNNARIPGKSLSRLSFNKKDDHYIATFEEDGCGFVVLDTRVPAVPVFEYMQHQSSLNSLSWAPHSAVNIVSGGNLLLRKVMMGKFWFGIFQEVGHCPSDNYH